MTALPEGLTLNGRRRSLASVPPDERLLDSLRRRWALTGTKEGCRTGGCGACAVLVDGRPVLSCLALTHEVAGRRLVTIEGAASDPVARRVQEAFAREGAVQCGYCTPGFVLALTGLLHETPTGRSSEELVEDLAGHLCRCTGYAAIRRAVARVAEEER